MIVFLCLGFFFSSSSLSLQCKQLCFFQVSFLSFFFSFWSLSLILQAFLKLLMTQGCLILFKRDSWKTKKKNDWSSEHVDKAYPLRAALWSCLGSRCRIIMSFELSASPDRTPYYLLHGKISLMPVFWAKRKMRVGVLYLNIYKVYSHFILFFFFSQYGTAVLSNL